MTSSAEIIVDQSFNRPLEHVRLVDRNAALRRTDSDEPRSAFEALPMDCGTTTLSHSLLNKQATVLKRISRADCDARRHPDRRAARRNVRGIGSIIAESQPER